MNFNFNNQLDFEKELQKKIGMMNYDDDKELDDLINEDPELRDLIKSDRKKKKTLDPDADDLSLKDLESEEEKEKSLDEKDLDDLLCEEDTKFKEAKDAEVLRKKTSKFEEEMRLSMIQADESKNNFRESMKNSANTFKEADESKDNFRESMKNSANTFKEADKTKNNLRESIKNSTFKDAYKTKNNFRESIKNSTFKEADKTKPGKDLNVSGIKISLPKSNENDQNKELEIEFYDEKVEKFFHSVEKMKSIGVLQEELALMDHIIQFNTKTNQDFDEFENKKFFVQNQIDKISLLVESGAMDLNEYKKSISKEIEWEKFLLTKLDTEEKIKNRNFVKKRIEKRIESIETELNQEVEVEEPEPEPVVETKAEEKSKLIEEAIKSPISKQNPSQGIGRKETEENKTIQSKKSLKGSIIASDIKSPKSKQQNPSEVIARKEPEANKTIKSKKSLKGSIIASEIKSEQPIEIKIKNQKLYDDASVRCDEYRKAVDYFINIESLKQAEDARSKVSKLSKALESMEQGKTIDEIDLPIAITPDYICNMTKQERLNNFSVIIKDFSKKKNDINVQIKSAVDGYTKLDPRTQATHKNQFHDSLKIKKTKLDNFTGIINKLMEMVKNPWIPSPLYVEKEEEEKVEKVNEDVGANELSIKIGKIVHNNLPCYIRFMFEITKDKVVTGLITKKEGSTDFQYSNTIKLDKNEFKYLHRKSIRLVLFEQSGFCCFKKDIEVGDCILKFDPLKSSSSFEGQHGFKLADNTITNSKIFAAIKIRQPTMEKEYIDVSRTAISITKTYPPFKGDNVTGIIDEEEKPRNINENAKVVKKPQQQPDKDVKQVKKQENAVREKNDGPPKAELEYQMSDFKKEELDNPDILENLTSLKVLAFKIAKVEDEIKKIEGRAPPKLREKLLKMKVNKNNLEAQMGGEITVNMYMGLLRYQLEHDRKLLKYFQDQKDPERSKLVAERIPVLISEIEEVVDYMSKNKS